jgi:hypothetical protein
MALPMKYLYLRFTRHHYGHTTTLYQPPATRRTKQKPAWHRRISVVPRSSSSAGRLAPLPENAQMPALLLAVLISDDIFMMLLSATCCKMYRSRNFTATRL